MSQRDVVIVSAARTAIGRFGGTLVPMSASDLGAVAIAEAVHRAGIDPTLVRETLMGNVLQAGQGQAPARQASIKAGLPVSVGATTLNKVCGSGLKTAMMGAAMLKVGDADVIVAGGMESMNNAPYLLSKARFGYRMGADTLDDGMVRDGLWCTFTGKHMGHSAEWIAGEYGLTREQLDAYALESHRRAIVAQDEDRFVDEIASVDVPAKRGQAIPFRQDECPRRETSVAKLAALKPAFCWDGLVTAGNASPISDGAAAVMLMRRETARELGCQPMARIVAYDQAAVEPLEIFTAPIYATQRVLARAGMSLADIDLVELNEAFASQTLADAQALDLNLDKTNVNGGALALGHPIGASGARVLVTLIYALRQRNMSTGLAALCLGGGEAVAMIIEME